MNSHFGRSGGSAWSHVIMQIVFAILCFILKHSSNFAFYFHYFFLILKMYLFLYLVVECNCCFRMICFSWHTIKSPQGYPGLFCLRKRRIRAILPSIEVTSKIIIVSAIQGLYISSTETVFRQQCSGSCYVGLPHFIDFSGSRQGTQMDLGDLLHYTQQAGWPSALNGPTSHPTGWCRGGSWWMLCLGLCVSQLRNPEFRILQSLKGVLANLSSLCPLYLYYSG